MRRKNAVAVCLPFVSAMILAGCSVSHHDYTWHENEETYRVVTHNGVTKATYRGRDGKEEVIDLATLGGRPGLCLAISRGDADRVRALLAADPSLARSAGPTGETPLHAVAFSGGTDITEMLIAAGADVNAADNMGERPLKKARFFNKDVARVLEARGAHE